MNHFPKFCLLSALLFLAAAAQAQKKELKTKFGKISDTETAMTSYPDDPDAPAVVLFDKGEVTHRYRPSAGFLFEFKRHKRIKIFRKEAYNLADVSIFYYRWQNVTDIHASSFNVENGKLVETKLEKENLFDEKLSQNYKVKRLTIPAVREGSIIELKYTIEDDYIIDIPGWKFQQLNIPTIWSEFEASVPTFVEFQKMSQGWVSFAVAEEKEESLMAGTQLTYQANTMHFVQENIPALKPEPFVLCPTDYLSQINFDIRAVYEVNAVETGNMLRLENGMLRARNNSWEKLGKELLEEVYNDFIKSSKHTKESAQSSTAGLNSDAEKTEALYAFVGKNYEANGPDFWWPSQSIDQLVKDRKGTATDLNLLFLNLLRQADVKAYPLLLSTHDNGSIMPFRITTDAFDRVITAVQTDEKTLVLIDAAAWPNPIGLLPAKDLNNEGLLLRSAEDISWQPLKNKELVRSACQVDATIGPEGGLSGALSFLESGYDAVAARAVIREKGVPAYIQERFKEFLIEGSTTEPKAENPENRQEFALKGAFRFETAGFATATGDKIYLTPLLGFGLKENPFKNPERKFPVHLGFPRSETYSFVFTLPAGYKVEESPKSAKLSFGENALTFDYFVETTPEKVKVNVRRGIRNPFVPVEVYADLQQFYGTLLAKLSEQIVLSKG